MTEIQEFQKKHGEAYSKLVRSPAFNEGMFLLNSEQLTKITTLTDDDITKNAVAILSDLRGWLRHELLLSTLHDRKTFDPTDLPAETYSPEEPQDEPRRSTAKAGRRKQE